MRCRRSVSRVNHFPPIFDHLQSTESANHCPVQCPQVVPDGHLLTVVQPGRSTTRDLPRQISNSSYQSTTAVTGNKSVTSVACTISTPRSVSTICAVVVLAERSAYSIQFSSVQFSSVQFSSVQSSPVQSSPVQSSPVQSSPVQSSPIQFNSIQHQRATPSRDKEFVNRSTMMTGEYLAGVAIVFFLRYETRDLTILRKHSRVP